MPPSSFLLIEWSGFGDRMQPESVIECFRIHWSFRPEYASRAQVRRALSGLERAGLIQLQSQELKLILKCNLASRPYSVQNKAVTKPSHQAVMEPLSQLVEINENLQNAALKADIGKTSKADTPLKEDIYYRNSKNFGRCTQRKNPKQMLGRRFNN